MKSKSQKLREHLQSELSGSEMDLVDDLIKAVRDEENIYCENVNHNENAARHHETGKVERVKMREEFEGGIVNWCELCQEEDSNFIEKE